MGSRDHSYECEDCGLYRGGMNNLTCDCDPLDGIHKDVDTYCWQWWLNNLGANLDNVAVLCTLRQAAYAKGFTDGTLLREFCEDYVPEPYFPTADTRPTAERLGWPNAASTS